MYVFRNADEIKDTVEPAFCYWAARDRGYTQGVGYIKSPRSIRPAMNLLARERKERRVEMVRAIVFIVTGGFFLLSVQIIRFQ